MGWILMIIGTAILITFFFSMPLTSEKKRQLAFDKLNKIKTYKTVEFKLPKRVEDGDEIKPYPIPNSNAVNFYEKNSFGGEGFLHKEFNKTLWNIINENRDILVIIKITNKNKGVAKIQYKG